MSPRWRLEMEELRARIKAAGLHIDESRLEMIRRLLSDALAPIRALHAQTPEPALTFDASESEESADDNQ